ncbi:MAG: hypothetical protein ABI164_09415 [Acidobacteriaceae bacterium]
MKISRLWNICGFLSLLILAHFWIVLLDPFKRGWHYPGEAAGFLVAVVAAGLLSVAAGIGGSRYWYGSTVAVALTVGFVMTRMQ